MEKIKVVIENKQKAVKIPTGIRLLMRRCCHAVLELENFEGSAEVDISIVDNQEIQEINREHRKIDAVTDVLSFPLGETDTTTFIPRREPNSSEISSSPLNGQWRRRSSTAIPFSGKWGT